MNEGEGNPGESSNDKNFIIKPINTYEQTFNNYRYSYFAPLDSLPSLRSPGMTIKLVNE
jgi:hypothetical protein